MKIPIGIVGSVLGATIAFHLAVVTLVTLPAEGPPRWFALAGITALSLLAGILVNGVTMQDFFKVSRAYNTLTSRLNPLLCGGIENVLQRRAKDVDLLKGLTLSAHAPIDGLFKVVATTAPPGATLRQRVHELNEGLLGFVIAQQIAGYIQRPGKNSGPNDVYDRSGRVIGQSSPVRDINRAKTIVGAKWVYSRPIFEKSGANPWSDKVVGVLSVHSTADDADNLFRNVEFQVQMDSLASDISPYLDALQMLLAKDKL